MHSDLLEIPNFSYSRLTEPLNSDGLMDEFRKVSREVIPIKSGSNSAKHENENMRESFVFKWHLSNLKVFKPLLLKYISEDVLL